jgi:CRISPR/Cas system CMR-associated protein Cmr5 small subunit
MTLPEGRQPIEAQDMAKLHLSTWRQEVEQLRAENERLREIATRALGEWEEWVEDQLAGTSMFADAISEVREARAALQQEAKP